MYNLHHHQKANQKYKSNIPLNPLCVLHQQSKHTSKAKTEHQLTKSQTKS
ncbi:hypothetical protein RchiOBHm_Chr6g0273211 [Rosa chinensis]|uniref:Uncharacterized protein n=1 Tax=Rosa chinensis TaxID=74649 RepID=A0A2P6PRH4_ROSCH|nr:hypothetical protein RchiOBHm_Chr6g0273211 [Rosa chinensis]